MILNTFMGLCFLIKSSLMFMTVNNLYRLFHNYFTNAIERNLILMIFRDYNKLCVIYGINKYSFINTKMYHSLDDVTDRFSALIYLAGEISKCIH